MKKLVVDSNIVFSGILNIDNKIGQILLKAPGEAAFFSCDFLKSEIREHRPKLLKITKLPPGKLDELESLVLQKVPLAPSLLQKTSSLVPGLISLYNEPYKGQEQGKVEAHRYSGSNT